MNKDELIQFLEVTLKRLKTSEITEVDLAVQTVDDNCDAIDIGFNENNGHFELYMELPDNMDITRKEE
jgi:hypothetical protein